MKGVFILAPPHEFSLFRMDDASKIVKEQANEHCEICGKVGSSSKNGQLVVHHIFPIGNIPRFANMFNHPSNLLVVCRPCHAKIHKPRGNPRAGFNKSKFGKE